MPNKIEPPPPILFLVNQVWLVVHKNVDVADFLS